MYTERSLEGVGYQAVGGDLAEVRNFILSSKRKDKEDLWVFRNIKFEAEVFQQIPQFQIPSTLLWRRSRIPSCSPSPAKSHS